MAELDQIGKLLILLGSLIGIVQGVLLVLNQPFGFAFIDFGLGTLIMGILVILFALIALVNSGFIEIKALEFSNKWLVILIIGVLMWVFGSDLGAILIIIGAILLVLK